MVEYPLAYELHISHRLYRECSLGIGPDLEPQRHDIVTNGLDAEGVD